MSGTWQSFLEQQGAHFDAAGVAHFGDPAAELAAADGPILADLSHYGLIAARGEEAASFLHNQFSNDVRQVDPGHHQLNSYCTPKGRILALFRLFQRGDAYYLRLPAPLLEPTLKRLRMFVLRSKLTLEDASADLARFGLAGAALSPVLSETFGALPGPDEAVGNDALSLLRVPGEHRFEVYGEPAAAQALWQRLREQAVPVGRAVWQWQSIRAGQPEVYPQTSEAFVPQMMNLHAIGGVSFRKGCYPGQEVVARMQYLGKLKRRMYLAHVDGADCPEPGTELFGGESESGQGTGKVVDARPAPGGGCDLLAVIQIAAVESGHPIRLHDADGPALRMEALPYGVPVDARP